MMGKLANAIEKRWGGELNDGWVLTVGTACKVCSHCAEYYDDRDEDEGEFSWMSCDTCGSNRGGSRYVAHLLAPMHSRIKQTPDLDDYRKAGFTILTDDGKPDTEHLSICTDCLLYIANGDEPDD